MVSITRRESPAQLFGLQRLNRILDEAFGGLPFDQGGNILTASWIPATDVSEDKDSIRIAMELAQSGWAVSVAPGISGWGWGGKPPWLVVSTRKVPRRWAV